MPYNVLFSIRRRIPGTKSFGTRTGTNFFPLPFRFASWNYTTRNFSSESSTLATCSCGTHTFLSTSSHSVCNIRDASSPRLALNKVNLETIKVLSQEYLSTEKFVTFWEISSWINHFSFWISISLERVSGLLNFSMLFFTHICRAEENNSQDLNLYASLKFFSSLAFKSCIVSA